MNPIGAYIRDCRDLSEAQFCERYPHPFLLHSTVTGALVPTDMTRGVTLDRLVLGEEGGDRPGRKMRQEEAYEVFALEPRNPKDFRLSIGCSSTCDLQINDKSVSTLHAYVERRSEGYAILDNDSAAGTQVDDEVLEPGQSKTLASGDRVTLGYVDLTFLQPADFHRFVRKFFGL